MVRRRGRDREVGDEGEPKKKERGGFQWEVWEFESP